ncbi:putative dynamin GTPase [Metarhizium anisopliae]
MTPIHAQSTPHEKYLFHIFRAETAGEASGGFEGTFWSVDVPQACQLHPAIWHSALAIASARLRQRTWTVDGSTQHYDDVGFRQYTKAIGHLVQATRKTDPSFEEQSLILMTTVLLLGFASLRGDFNQVEFFARHGLRLFAKWDFRQRAKRGQQSLHSNVISVTSLISLLENLLVQYSWARHTLIPAKLAQSSTAIMSSTTPFHEYQALQIAHFEMLSAQQLGSTNGYWEPSRDIRQTWLWKLSACRNKLLQARQESGHGDGLSKSLLMMEMTSLGLQVCVQARPMANELCWDKFIPKFRRMVDIAEQLFDTRPDNHGEREPAAVFAPGPSAMGLLYMVASACREYGTRARAMALLQRLQQRDGLLDSGLFACLSETKMRIETTGRDLVGLAEPRRCTCIPKEYVCGHHRVRDVGVEFLDRGMARLNFESFDGGAHSERKKSLIVHWNGNGCNM